MHLFKTHLAYNYKPAILKKGTFWSIEYYAYNPSSKKLVRCRERYGMNRIKNLSERAELAKKIIAEINTRLPLDWPFTRTDLPPLLDFTYTENKTAALALQNSALRLEDIKGMFESFSNELLKKVEFAIDEKLKNRFPERDKNKEVMNIVDAINFGYKYRCENSKSELSHASNSSRKNLFIDWLEESELLKININDFTDQHARNYMDKWEYEKKVSDSTFNNKLIFIRGIFNEIINRTNTITENPFKDIKNKKRRRKIVDFLSDEEMKKISEYYRKNRPWMYKAMLLQFFCWIRPIELRRLKFGMFDLKKGQIRFKGVDTKNDEDDNITIPNAIIKEFRNPEFAKYPPHFYLFGRHLKPSTTKCGIRSMNGLHNSILDKLKMNRKGVFWYIWKHMGVTLLSEKEGLTPIEMMKHGRWKDLNVIHHYLHNSGKVMPNVQKIENRVI